MKNLGLLLLFIFSCIADLRSQEIMPFVYPQNNYPTLVKERLISFTDTELQLLSQPIPTGQKTLSLVADPQPYDDCFEWRHDGNIFFSLGLDTNGVFEHGDRISYDISLQVYYTLTYKDQLGTVYNHFSNMTLDLFGQDSTGLDEPEELVYLNNSVYSIDTVAGSALQSLTVDSVAYVFNPMPGMNVSPLVRFEIFYEYQKVYKPIGSSYDIVLEQRYETTNIGSGSAPEPEIYNLLDVTSEDPIQNLNMVEPIMLKWYPNNSMACDELPFNNYEIQILKLENFAKDIFIYDTVGANDDVYGFEKAIVDWEKATTIQTGSSKTRYDYIPTKGKGLYIWRVRPIADYYPDGANNPLNYGQWSQYIAGNETATLVNDTGSIPATGDTVTYKVWLQNNNFAYNYNELLYITAQIAVPGFILAEAWNRDLNWSHTKYYTEANNDSVGTLSYQQLTYADHLLNQRQTQMRTKESDLNLISGVVLDNLGRPAVSILPFALQYPESQTAAFGDSHATLLNKTGMAYQNKLIEDQSANSYSIRHFDSLDVVPQQAYGGKVFQYYDGDTTYYSGLAEPMPVPSAQGYPFSRTVFSTDGTGRPIEVSGVGKNLKIAPGPDTARTTKYFYSSPTNTELLAVFGNEAPNPARIQKIITVDPNGVSTITYKNNLGKVIASCYVSQYDTTFTHLLPFGDYPDNKLELDIAYDRQGTIAFTEFGLTETRGFVPTLNTTAEVSYSAEPVSLEFTLCQGDTNGIDACANIPYRFSLLLEDAKGNAVHTDSAFYSPSASPCPDLGGSVINDSDSIALNKQTNYYVTTNFQLDRSPLDSLRKYVADSYTDIYFDAFAPALDSLDKLDSIYRRNGTYILSHFYDYLEAGYTTSMGRSVTWTIDSSSDPWIYTTDLGSCLGTLTLPTDQCTFKCELEVDYGYEAELLQAFTGEYPSGSSNFDLIDTDVSGTIEMDEILFFEGEDLPLPLVPDFPNGAGLLDTLINRMHLSGLYQDEDICGCWDATLATAPGVLLRPDGTGQGVRILDKKYDIINSFLECTGRALLGISNTPYAKSGTDGFITDAYRYFRYVDPDPLTDDYCETSFYPSGGYAGDTIGGLNTANEDLKKWELFYRCQLGQPGLEDEVREQFSDQDQAAQNNESRQILTEYLDSDPIAAAMFKIKDIILANPSPIDTTAIKEIVSELENICQARIQERERELQDSIAYFYIDNGHYISGSDYPLPDPATDTIGFDLVKAFTRAVVEEISNKDCDLEYDALAQTLTNNGNSNLDMFQKVIDREKFDFAFPDTSSYPITCGGDYRVILEGDYRLTSLEAQTLVDLLNDKVEEFVDTTLWSSTPMDTIAKVFNLFEKREEICDTMVAVLDRFMADPSRSTLEELLNRECGDSIYIPPLYPNCWLGIEDTINFTGWDPTSYYFSQLGYYSRTYHPYEVLLAENWNLGLYDRSPYERNATQTSNSNRWGFFRPNIALVGPDSVPIPKNKTPYSFDVGTYGTDMAMAFVLRPKLFFTSYWENMGHIGSVYGQKDSEAFYTYFVIDTSRLSWQRAVGSDPIVPFIPIKLTTDHLYTMNGDTILNKFFGNNGILGSYGLDLHFAWLKADTILPEAICFRFNGPLTAGPDFAYERPKTCLDIMGERVRQSSYSQVTSHVLEKVALADLEIQKLWKDAPRQLSYDVSVSYSEDTEMYTLYYYDRAGNLVRTVPPAGVKPSAAYTRDSMPAHTMASVYRYNSLGQLVSEIGPDFGEKRYWYNRRGQLRFSQTAEQADSLVTAPTEYTYFKYDRLARLIETGEITGNSLADSVDTFLDSADWPVYGHVTMTNFTRTVYTEEPDSLPVPYNSGFGQRNLRNRISYTYHDPDGTDGALIPTAGNAGDPIVTYYSYDPHGNVEWLLRQIPIDGTTHIGFEPYVSAKLDYEYDLVSGKVNQLTYNLGRADEFHQRYEYDSQNRLARVYSSRYGNLWDRDAEYEYYAHGPLKRIKMGEDSLQTLDYAYTIEGWLKGINSPWNDQFGAGAQTTQSLGYVEDGFSMVLHYNGADFVHDMDSIYNGTVPQGIQDLYNGNISAWESGFAQQQADLTVNMHRNSANVYEYDLANRIRNADWQVRSAMASAFSDPGDEYDAAFEYDPNGNITDLRRSGYDRSGNNLMDSLIYLYNPSTNQLDQVQDIAGEVYGTDFGSQISPSTYEYDLEGNLTRNLEEGVDSIGWTHDGKVATIRRAGIDAYQPGTTDYQYDALRQRAIKTNSPDGKDPSSEYYVRDASGNTIAVYTLKNVVEELPFGSEGGEFCLSFTVFCQGSIQDRYLTMDTCLTDFTYDSTSNELTVKIAIPSCTPPDTCHRELTINLDSLSKPIPNVSCDFDNSGWFNFVNYEQPEEAYQELRLAEYNIYGSEGHGRFVTWKPDSLLYPPTLDSYAQYGTDSVYHYREKTQIPRIIGEKEYEIKDHLGNVRMTFSDIRSPNDPFDLSLGSHLNLLNISNYYPFGMQQPDRTWTAGQDYRYGFQNQEKDSEVYGEGNLVNYTFRMNDTRLGRFFALDPLKKKYPSLSPYHFSHNSPIGMVEIEGLEGDEVRFRLWQYSQGGIQREVAERVMRDNGESKVVMEIGLGFIPYVGQTIDAKDTYQAFNGGDTYDKIFAVAGWIPGLDLLKAFRKIKKGVQISSDAANFKHVELDYDPPYVKGSDVLEVTTGETESFVRLYKEGFNEPQGAFMMKEADLYDVDGNLLSPEQLQDKFALDYLPDGIVDVSVPPNTTLRTGTVASRQNVGNGASPDGGAQQFQLIDEIDKKNFKNKRKLNEMKKKRDGE